LRVRYGPTTEASFHGPGIDVVTVAASAKRGTSSGLQTKHDPVVAGVALVASRNALRSCEDAAVVPGQLHPTWSASAQHSRMAACKAFGASDDAARLAL